MKVKIICAPGSENLEMMINEFINDKYVYDIKYPQPFKWDRALIMYDEELREPMAVQHVKTVFSEDEVVY